MPHHPSSAGTTDAESPRIEVGRADSSNSRFRMLKGIHESYAQNLGTALSTFLRMDVQAALREITTERASSFIASLPRPSCLMMFRLHPLADRMFVFMDCGTVFPLLELLLGGRSDALTSVTVRNLTEVEWSLLEEIVKVMVRQLGEAWQFFAAVEFEVDSLVSEPGLMPAVDGAHALVRLTFDFKIGEASGVLELAVPESFYDAAALKSGEPLEAPDPSHPSGEDQRMARLEHASVELEVLLEGPTLAFRELIALEIDRVLRFDYPLDRPLRGLLNGDIALEGQIVNTGRKPAFRVTALPSASSS
jgi:flagellar motor switch protein FliM